LIKTGENSPSDLSGNESDWKTVPLNSIKRNSSPNYTSPTTIKKKKKTGHKYFYFCKPFHCSYNEVPRMDTVKTQSVNNENKTSKPPPPIFIQEQINYNFCQKINELTDTSGFDCKSSTKGFNCKHTALTHTDQLSNTSRIITSHFTHTNQKRKDLIAL
jgi:hypothetical protein